ncbi:GntR family transcriptional regulator [Amycolatopsis sp. DSM 110486]|uniref:GntR family transcriptional regulator n=1 Tax=Amycolatopsis sp. DSM 110486 TaxID=2865832 RepID=UPI001C69A41A|nr:GntR family transcriptional regulator [Amycolatopsis sp. DSM 110486]QYN17632.1 GntR family transcriptional regulator [Amycolatopsis sp. DSM 110486]
MHTYELIAQTLATEIDNGTWPAGSLLPTLAELEKRFSASRITVRGALEQLDKRGYVYTGRAEGRRGTVVRHRGRTSIVANLAIRPDRPNSDTSDAFIEAAELAGRTPSKRFERRIEIPPKAIADRLGIAPDEPVVARTLTQLLDEEPWSIEVGHYPMDLAREVGLDVETDIKGGTARALEAAGYKEIAHFDEVTDETADADEAYRLAVPIGSPLLVVVRTAATADRVTRVMRYLRLGGRTRLIWEQGAREGLDVIAAARNRGTE